MKILKVIWKIVVIIWGLLTTLLVVTDLVTSINRVLVGEVQIVNIFWYFGIIPSLFLLILLISVIFKKSIFLKRFAGILGLLTATALIIVGVSGFNISLAIVIAFSLYVFIKSFQKVRIERGEEKIAGE